MINSRQKLLKKLYKLSNAEVLKITPYLDNIQPKLTIKQRKFVYFYVMNDFNKIEAMKNAGYNAKNTKDKDRLYRVMVCEYLTKPNINDAIAQVCKHAIKSKIIIEKKLFDLLWRRAIYDILTFQNSDGSFKALNDISESWRCVVDGTEIKFYGKDAQQKVIVSKLADRDKAIDKLDKYIQMTKDKAEDAKNELTDETMKELMDMLYGKK